MAEISDKHQKFIQLVAGGKTQSQAYKSMLDTEKLAKLTPGTERTMGARLAKKYALEILAAKKAFAEKIESQAKIEEGRKAFAALLTQAEVDAEMCNLIKTGSESTKIKAMDMYNRRFASYSPEKVAGRSADDMPAIINWNPETNGSDKKKA